MKLTLEPTAELVTTAASLTGLPARIWRGVDEHGAEIFAVVLAVAVHNSLPPEVHARFEAELLEVAGPVLQPQSHGAF